MKQVLLAIALILSASVVYGSLPLKDSEPSALVAKKKRKKGSDEAFKQGQFSFHVGPGFIAKSDYGDMEYELYGKNELKKHLPFNFMADYGVASVLSVGLFMGFYAEDITITDNTNPDNIYGFNNKFKQFGLRTTYHQIIEGKIDPYAALIVGFNKCKGEVNTDLKGFNYLDPYKGGFAWSIHAGANYYFTDNIGAYLEVGYGKWIPILNLGASVKF